MSMLKERLQVLIGRDQRERLEREALARGTSVATLVREAIDLAFPPTAGLRQMAATRLLGLAAMDVPPGEGLLDELAELRGRRA